MAKKILLSGVKPTGRPHIGNYFGAMKQFVDLQDKYDCYFFIADYHGLNLIQNGDGNAQLNLEPRHRLSRHRPRPEEVCNLQTIRRSRRIPSLLGYSTPSRRCHI